MKKCKKCELVKKESEFSRSSRHKDKINPICKECYNINQKVQRKKSGYTKIHREKRTPEEREIRYKAGRFRTEWYHRTKEPKIPIDDIEQRILQVLGKNCLYCSSLLSIENLSADHKISIFNGGKTTLDNLEFQICRSCNSSKGNFNEDSFLILINCAKELGIANELLSKLRRSNTVFGRR